MSVIDFSKWNTMPWWKRNGYKTSEEAWSNFSFAQTVFRSSEPVYDDTGRYIGDRYKGNKTG